MVIVTSNVLTKRKHEISVERIMIGDFGERAADKRSAVTKEMTNENWTEFRVAQEAVGENVIKQVGAKLETHNILVLVDLQGMYMGIHSFLHEKKFPIDGGLVLSRLAFFQILDVFERAKEKTLKLYDGPALDFEGLLGQIKHAGPEGQIDVKKDATYVRFIPKFELFYAPAPLDRIEWQLRKQVRSGSPEAKEQLERIKDGILKNRYFTRDYAAYDDFISKLKANPEYSKSQEGFFNYYVGPKGLQVFDEKEVDSRIVIRAMDAFYNYEADTLCIVSSDQDFIPIHARAREFGIQSYQADLAKFRLDDRIARKFKDLGTNFLRGRFDPIWPLKIIIEAGSSSEYGLAARYKLAKNEIDALCEMHNGMNDFHVSMNYTSDDQGKMVISKPVK